MKEEAHIIEIDRLVLTPGVTTAQVESEIRRALRGFGWPTGRVSIDIANAAIRAAGTSLCPSAPVRGGDDAI
jgi:hypothetical protein